MKSHFKFVLLIFVLLVFSAVNGAAQKAEPLRVKFAKGKTSATMTGRLADGEEMDFVFSAKRGQIIAVRVTSVPKGKIFNFELAGDAFEIETELDYYRDYSFKAPETGEYYVIVRKRPIKNVASAKFYLFVSVR